MDLLRILYHEKMEREIERIPAGLDTLRGIYIHDEIKDFLGGLDADGLGEATQNARELNPWTVAYLVRYVPEWREYIGHEDPLCCVGPVEGLCSDCKCLPHCSIGWLTWGIRIPLFITRVAMKELTPSAFMVLVCLASHANWKPDDNHFGMCWLKYDLIKTETGIQQPQRQIKELLEKGCIQAEHSVRKSKPGEFSTTNCFIVNWIPSTS